MWDNWNQSMTAQARAQDISIVLDPNYAPPNQEARDLFIEHQKFMYVVFEKTLLTDKGKALVWHYQTSFDAQAIYRNTFCICHALNQSNHDCICFTVLHYYYHPRR